jgi:hypothetical protein
MRADAISRGSTESLLNEDLAILFRGTEIGGLLEPLKRSFGRLHIEPGDLAGRGVNSPLFPLAYLALKHAGAKIGIAAWGSRSPIKAGSTSFNGIRYPEVPAQGARI